jgi:hypothetical protein
MKGSSVYLKAFWIVFQLVVIVTYDEKQPNWITDKNESISKQEAIVNITSPVIPFQVSLKID